MWLLSGYNVVKTMPFLPPMTGSGLLYTTYLSMVMTGGWFMALF
jgi:hypothetical protein